MAPPPYTELSLSEIVEVCSSLANISAHSVGSSNYKTLLSSTTGSVFFVNDALTILSSLQFSHPVARLIVSSLQHISNSCADGSKIFILYVAEILHSTQKQLKILGCLNPGQSEKVFLKKLSNSLRKFQEEYFLQKILEACLPFCYNVGISNSDEIWIRLEQVIKTILNSSYKDYDSQFLATLLINFLQSNITNIEFVDEILESAIDHFDLCLIENIGKNFSSSQTLPGILIPLQQHLIPKSNFIAEIKNSSFLILRNFLKIDSKKHSQQTILRIYGNSNLPKMYCFKNFICKKFLDDCNFYGVQIILCCEEIPQYAASLFEQHHILAVPYVPEEFSRYFTDIFKKQQIDSIIEPITDGNIYPFLTCKKLSISNSDYLQIKIKPKEQVCISSTLLLSAPTQALFHNLRKQVFKCLNSLKMCFDNSLLEVSKQKMAITKFPIENTSEDQSRTENLLMKYPKRLVTIPVNMFQFQLHHLFESRSFKELFDSNTEYQIWSEILHSAFWQVFLQCSNERKINISEYLKQKKTFLQSPNNSFDSGAFQFCLPLQSEFHVLESALRLVHELFSIEGILWHKKMKI